MSTALQKIEDTLTDQNTQVQLAQAMNLNPNDEQAIQRAYHHAASVIQEIQKTQGQQHGDLTKCTVDSIKQAVIDAAQFQISIDGRKLAHLESRWDKQVGAQVASLQIDTNGLIAKIKEHHPDASFIIQPVFQDDYIKVYGRDGDMSFEYESHNPFGGADKLQGIVVQIQYGNVSDVQTISVEDLRNIASKAKGSFAWKDFPLERMKTAALKRAAKWHFRQNTTIQAIVDYDNRQYELNKPASTRKSSVIENINSEVSGESEAEPEPVEGPEVIEHEPEPEPQISEDELNDLIQQGEQASEQGMDAYKTWAQSLSEAQRGPLREEWHPYWLSVARKADAEAQEDEVGL
jgi:hypothetical protein